ncbi:hypothetical protein [Erythrobacter sp.]|uniref:hypothetical protein n=1 Tax=Erythrobacter sp. TaxID=1042 RepID=UPI002EB89048|nr:hypothetical protein [Erythrobacter sp.]
MIEIILLRMQGHSIVWSRIPLVLWIFAGLYAIFALLLGQVFGEFFPFSSLWPSGLIVGAAFAAPVLAMSFPPRTSKQAPRLFRAFAILVSALFFTFALWLLPRMVGLGLIDLPNLSWGVRL